MKLYIALFLVGMAYEMYVIAFFHFAKLGEIWTASFLVLGFCTVNDLLWRRFLQSDYNWKGIVAHNVGYSLGSLISLTYFPLT